MRRPVANRIGIAAVGLVIAAAGAYVLARRYHVVVPGRASSPVYPHSLARWLHGHDWIWIAVAAGAVVVGLLALWWLYLALRSQHLATLRPDPVGEGGRTRMAARVLADAVEDDLVELPGVRRASVALAGAPDAPRMEIRVTAYRGTDLPELRGRIVAEAVTPARLAYDAGTLPVLVALRIGGGRRMRHVD